MGLFDFLKTKPQFEKSVLKKEVYIFEAHEYEKVLGAAVIGMFPSNEKEQLDFFRKKACASFNLINNDSVAYVKKTDWNAPEVRFDGAAPIADTFRVHAGILSYFVKIGVSKDITTEYQLQSAILDTKVSGMPNVGIMWFCVKLT